jgi:hypothetical protein
MKRYTEILLAILLSEALYAQSLQPDTFNWTWARTNSSAFADTSNVWIAGTTYTASNIVYTSVGVTQDLTSAGAELRVGDMNSNCVFYATVTDAKNGMCAVNFIIPTATPTLQTVFRTAVQLTVTSGTTRVIYRGQKYLYVINPLH